MYFLFLRYRILGFMRICYLFTILGIIISSQAYANSSYRIADHPLFVAAYEGSATKADELIKSGAKVDEQVGNDTPLTYAISWQKIGVVKTLLQHGADPNKTIEGKTPLTVAINHWSIHPNTDSDEAIRMDMIKLLLKAGADPNLPKAGRTPLTMAFQTRQMHVFEQLKQAGAKFNTKGYAAPLIEAAEHGKISDIEALFKVGVGPDDMDDGFGCTALCKAIDTGQSEAVRVLLKAGAKWDADERPSSSSTATWGWRIATSKSDILKQFLDKGLAVNAIIPNVSSKESLLSIAAENSETSNVNLLISRGAVVNFQDENGNTPLMIAAQNGKTKNIKALLAAKADYSLMNKWGKTAKILAVDANKEEAVQLLVAAGADEYAGSTIPSLSRYAMELMGPASKTLLSWCKFFLTLT